jgi:hypothetical protein
MSEVRGRVYEGGKVMKIACFDLKGVLVNHNDLKRKIPLMDDLLNGLKQEGWELYLVSTFDRGASAKMLRDAGISAKLDIVDVYNEDKGEAILRLKDQTRAKEIIFIDDKPKHLKRVQGLNNNSIRTIGFVGSMKYVGEPWNLAKECAKKSIELALSVVDLCETLQISLLSTDLSDMSMDELIMLIPGLDHPLGAFGETANFDHRSIIAELLERDISGYEDLIYKRIGWIMCYECLFKALVEFVLASNKMDRDQVLGKAYKYEEYREAIRVNRENVLLTSSLKCAMDLARQGINEIGADAQRCRPKGRKLGKINEDRMKRVSNDLAEVLW